MAIKDFVVERMHRVYEMETGRLACHDGRNEWSGTALNVLGHAYDVDSEVSRFWEVRFRLEIERCGRQFGQPGGDLVEKITPMNYYLLELPTFLRSEITEELEERMKWYYENRFDDQFAKIMSKRDGTIRFVMSEHFCNLTWAQRRWWRLDKMLNI
jgi:hypothetical protein